MFNRKRKSQIYKLHYHRSTPPVLRNSRKKTPGRVLRRTVPLSKRSKRAISLILAIICTTSITYGVFFSHYFDIKNISIADENIESKNVGEKISSTISKNIGKNIIFTNTTELETKVLNNFPELENIKIKKSYPDKLIIQFSEYPLVANLISQTNTIKKTYIVNSIGYAIKENLENPNLPFIKIKSEEPLNTSNSAIEVNKLKYILEAMENFENKFGMRVMETEYKKIPREIHILTEKNFYIWLDMQTPAEDQFKKLKKAMVKLDIFKENLEYIDLRIAGADGDKIIYKRR